MPVFVRLTLHQVLGDPYGNETVETEFDTYWPTPNTIPEIPDKTATSIAIAGALSALQYSLVRYTKCTWTMLPEQRPTGGRPPYDPDNGFTCPLSIDGARSMVGAGDLADIQHCVWIARDSGAGLPGRLAVRGALNESSEEPVGKTEQLSSTAIVTFGGLTAGLENALDLIMESGEPFQFGIITYPQTGKTYPATPAGQVQVPVRTYGPRQFRPVAEYALDRRVIRIPVDKK